MLPTLSSSRLILRPFVLADAADVQRLAGDARIADTTTTIPHPYPDGEAEAWIGKHAAIYEAGNAAVFAVVLKDSGELVGAASLIGISQAHARAVLGYWMGVEYWGRGYCTEAVLRLMDFARQQWGISRITASCLARNPASARVMQKAGMQQEGLLVQDILKNGRYEDVLLYGCLLPGRSAKG